MEYDHGKFSDQNVTWIETGNCSKTKPSLPFGICSVISRPNNLWIWKSQIILRFHISSVGKRICLGELLVRNTVFSFHCSPRQDVWMNSNLCQTNRPRRWNPQSDSYQVHKHFKPLSFPVFTNQFPTIINSPQHQREKSLVLSFNRTSEHVLHLFQILLYNVTQIRL